VKRLRFVLVTALLVLVVTMRYRGLLLGLSMLAVNELCYHLLQLEGPGRSRRTTVRWARLRGLARWLGSRLGRRGPRARSGRRSPGWRHRLGVLRALRRPLGWLGRWRQPAGRVGFPSYDRIMGEVAWSRYSRRDFDVGLRRRLVEAASVRLEVGHGIDLADPRNVEACRELLGPTTWSLLAPDRPASDSRSEPGVDLPALEHIVSTIEGLRSGQEPSGAISTGTTSTGTGLSGTRRGDTVRTEGTR
jgi:hypothetical protein